MFRFKYLIVPLLVILSFSIIFQTEASANTESENGSRLQGYALKQPVSIYSSTSREGNILKSYDYNQSLVYKPYSSDWYIVVVYKNGISYRGYLHKDDVGSRKAAPYVKGVA